MEVLKQKNIIIQKKQLASYLNYLNQLNKNDGKCATCSTASGLFTCRECQAHFCTQHVAEHRQKLGKQMRSVYGAV